MSKQALLTGITGQDGAYLAQLLLGEGYEVHGVIRRSSHRGVEDHRLRWLGVADKVRLHDGDLTDLSSLLRVVQEIRPTEIYNLAAQSFVASSWRQPVLTANVTAVGVTNMLEAMRLEAPDARFYQASSSEMFGLIQESEQNENTPFYPRSPLRGGQALRPLDYRQLSRKLWLSRLLRHLVQPRKPAARHRIRHAQSQRRRGADQARPAQRIAAGQHRRQARLGPRASDYVRAMWLMLQQDKPDDYVVATGRTTSVRDMCRIAFDHVGLDMANTSSSTPPFIAPRRSTSCSATPPRRGHARLGAEISLEPLSRNGRRRSRARQKPGRRLIAQAPPIGLGN